MRLGGQLRVASKVIIGWDMNAALAMARALGIDVRAVVELLPEIEAEMAAKLNDQIRVGADNGG